jgi:putative transcriptional regulator
MLACAARMSNYTVMARKIVPPAPAQTPADTAAETAPETAETKTSPARPAGKTRRRAPSRARLAQEWLSSLSLAGQVLIAMPALDDQNFHRSVIFVCAHTGEGAMGIVVNRPLAKPTFQDLLQQLSVDPTPPARTIRLLAGGPVDNARGFVLHTADWTSESSLKVGETLALTASLDVLKAIAEGGGPRDGILALGYAGWGPGQLDRELQANSWLTAPVDMSILFDAEHETKWRRALATLKIDPLLLSAAAGHA